MTSRIWLMKTKLLEKSRRMGLKIHNYILTRCCGAILAQ